MTNIFIAAILCISALSAIPLSTSSEIRGLPRSKLPFYDPSRPFKCLDGSGEIAWLKVNDDYCDCRDGSDEPGTSACTNGHFFCRNKGYKAKYILSSRVNDGICDCCDGTDEYDSWKTCADTCWQEGKEAREAAELRHKLLVEGHQAYSVWVKDVTANIAERRKRLDEVANELASFEPRKLEKETETKAAEELANTAKEEHKKIWEEGKDRRKAEKVFNELDTDTDGRITLADLQTHPEFDVNADGSVTHDELKEYTESLEEADFAAFLEKIWPNIKTVYKPPVPTTAPPPVTQPSNEAAPDAEAQEQPPEAEPAVAPAVDSEETQEPEFPPETKELVEKAEKLRLELSSLEGQLSTLSTEKQDLEKLVNGDFGTNNAFFPLADSKDCYEFNDREYTYKLCPFREVTQIQKSGGGSTSLGHYSGWAGGEGEDKYAVQEYKDGQGCWNGPNRSVRLSIVCGPRNEVLSAAEPSRCEYSMEFASPAACSTRPSEQSEEEHDEL